MRKPRVTIYDDDLSILNLLREYFDMRGYEVRTFDTWLHCPVYPHNMECENRYPCSDVVLSDFRIGETDGIEMLQHQSRRGCPVDPRNKALASGDLDERAVENMRKMGIHFFQKPFNFSAVSRWLDECERRIDVTQPLGTKRSAARHQCHEEINFFLPGLDAVQKGVCMNVSSTGICLRIHTPLIFGQQVTVEPGTEPAAKTASVRWVREIEQDSYLTGLQYA